MAKIPNQTVKLSDIEKVNETVKESLNTEQEFLTDKVTADDSEAKQAFRIHMALYKKQNPKKYALKEQALLKKLNSL